MPSTPGHCSGTGGCHTQIKGGFKCGTNKDDCYAGLVAKGLINTSNPASSSIINPDESPLAWFGGGMPMDNPDENPDAAAKLFVDGAPEVRAHRRWLELKGLGIERTEAEVLAEINARDAADRSRPISPLTQAADATLLDTTDLDIDAAFAAALSLVEAKVRSALGR